MAAKRASMSYMKSSICSRNQTPSIMAGSRPSLSLQASFSPAIKLTGFTGSYTPDPPHV